MKTITKYSYLFVSLLISQYIIAQEDSANIIIYDFSKDSIYPKKDYWFKEDEHVIFKIKNINLLLYNVTINKEKADFTDENDLPGKNLELENGIKSFSTDFQLFINQFIDNVNTINNTETVKGLSKATEERNKKIYKNAMELMKDTLLIQNQISRIAQEISLTDNSPNEKVISLNYQKDSLKQLILFRKQKFLVDNLDSNDIATITQKMNDKIKEIEDNFVMYQYMVIYYESLYATLYQNLSRSEISSNTLIASRDSLTQIFFLNKEVKSRPGVTDLSRMIEEIFKTKMSLIKKTRELNLLTLQLQKSIDRQQLQNQKIPNKPKDVDLLLAKGMLTNLSQLLSNTATLNKIDDLSNEIQILYKSFETYTFELSEKELDLSGIDNLRYNVKIVPSTTLKNIKPIRKESFTININTYQGIKFDISVGAYFNIGLADRDYYYDHSIVKDNAGVVVSDLVKIKEKKNQNSFIPFVGTQLNVYWRPGPRHYGLGFNFGLSTNSSELRYYLGIANVFGKKERIVLSAGIVGGRVKTLSGQFNQHDTYDFKSDNFPSSPEVVDAFKIGGYVSITFNLFNKKGRSIIGIADKK